MADGRVGMTPEQEAKLDEVLRFFRRIETAFAPPRPEPLDGETAEVERKLAEVMGEEPSAEDLIAWSLPGPLPSELRAFEASGESPESGPVSEPPPRLQRQRGARTASHVAAGPQAQGRRG